VANKVAKIQRTKAQIEQARAEFRRKKAAQMQRLTTIKRQVAGYDPSGAHISEETVIRQLQNLLVNDDRALVRMAEEMNLSPGTVQRIRFGLTSRPTFRTVYRILAARGISLTGAEPARVTTRKRG